MHRLIQKVSRHGKLLLVLPVMLGITTAAAQTPLPAQRPAQQAGTSLEATPLRLPSEKIPAEMFQLPLPEEDETPKLPAPSAQAFTKDAPVTSAAAYTAYQLGAYLTALNEATRQVEKDKDPAAMALIGVIHLNGAGVPVDEPKAVEWFELASARGHAPAMVELGLLKLEGRGTKRDKEAAASLFEKAAQLGDPAALYNMGLLYLEGQVRPKDFNLAARNFETAARAGNADAQYAYALMLKEGRGILPNEEEAIQWLAKAASQDNTDAQLEYAIALFNGNGVERNEAEAAKLLARASDAGNGAAQIRLARLYASGRGLSRDEVRAGAWYLTAKAKGAQNEWLDSFWNNLSADEKADAEKMARVFKGENSLIADTKHVP